MANRGGAAGRPMGANAYAGPGPQAPAAFAAYEEANITQPWQQPTRSGKPVDDPVQKNNFPAQYIDRDPRDTYYSLKKQTISEANQWLGTGGPNAGAQAVVPITDADVQYFKHKMDQEEYQNFKIWSEQWYDFSDPAQVRLYQEAFPDYFEQRATLIKNMGDNMTKYAILRLLGPRTRDDFMFMWLVQTGKVPMIKGPLWDPKKWADQGPKKQLAFFNPWRMVDGTNPPNRVNLKNRMDPVGKGPGSYNASIQDANAAGFGFNHTPAVGQDFIFKAASGGTYTNALNASQNIRYYPE